MFGFQKAFERDAPKGWRPQVGEKVIAPKLARTLTGKIRRGHAIALLGIVTAVAGKFFKVHLWAGSPDFIDGKFVGKSDFEIHELRPAPKGRKREIATVE